MHPMNSRNHGYRVSLNWTGNTGAGTRDRRAYRRTHDVAAAGKPAIAGSSDPAFRGDRDRWNPEELLVVSLAQCHMLWYLDLAARHGVVVTGYRDDASGTMTEHADGSGNFTEVVLRPHVTIAPGSDAELAQRLHDAVDELCFIARSVNFPVRHQPITAVAG
jgi:organic hydroperoxide reductase OsmC/OhrA